QASIFPINFLLIPAAEQRMFGGIFPNRGICTTVQRDLHAPTVNGLNLLERDRAIEHDRCIVLNLDPIAHRETKTIIATKGLQREQSCATPTQDRTCNRALLTGPFESRCGGSTVRRQAAGMDLDSI